MCSRGGGPRGHLICSRARTMGHLCAAGPTVGLEATYGIEGPLATYICAAGVVGPGSTYVQQG
jgi:hypothetical protein